jgi:hypothetical protein
LAPPAKEPNVPNVSANFDESEISHTTEDSGELSSEEQRILQVKNKNLLQLHSPLKLKLTTPHRPKKQKNIPLTAPRSPSPSNFSRLSNLNDISDLRVIRESPSKSSEMQIDLTNLNAQASTPRKKKIIPVLRSPEK